MHAAVDPAPHVLWVNQFAVTPGDGGTTRHFELGRELVRGGWGVTVCASDFTYQGRRYTRRRDAGERSPVLENLDAVELVWLWAADYQRNDWRRVWNWLSFGRSLLRWGRETRPPDVVIGSSPSLFAALAAERLARRWGVPFVLEVRDIWPESLRAVGARRGPGYLMLLGIARYLYRRADRILVLATGAGDHLRRRGVPESRLSFVPNGVDTTAFDGISRPARDTFTLVYAGAHGPANGLGVVLDAAERLHHDPRIRFLLVGDGPAKSALVASAERRGLRNVEFRDPVAKEAVPAILAEADAGLMVLRDAHLFTYGVSPNKLFDYFAAGLPVVCNVTGEVAATVEAVGAGEVTSSGSAEDLAAAIGRLARTPPERRRAMGQSAREWVVRERARPVLAARLRAALEPLVLGGAPAAS